jgi:hypothetical protein
LIDHELKNCEQAQTQAQRAVSTTNLKIVRERKCKGNELESCDLKKMQASASTSANAMSLIATNLKIVSKRKLERERNVLFDCGLENREQAQAQTGRA